MLRITDKFLDIFLKQKIIEKDMKDVYRYGLEILFSSLFTTFSILAVSFLLDSLELGFLYLGLTIPLKITAGGYHADTYKKCFIISNITFIVLLCVHQIILQYSIPIIIWLIVLYCSTFYIFIKAPVENIHQPLSSAKITRNKQLARTLLFIDCSIIICLIIAIPTSEISRFLILCVLLVALYIIPTQKKGGAFIE